MEPELPVERVRLILETLDAQVLVTTEKLKEKAEGLGFQGKILLGRRSGTDGSEPVTSGSP